MDAQSYSSKVYAKYYVIFQTLSITPVCIPVQGYISSCSASSHVPTRRHQDLDVTLYPKFVSSSADQTRHKSAKRKTNSWNYNAQGLLESFEGSSSRPTRSPRGPLEYWPNTHICVPSLPGDLFIQGSRSKPNTPRLKDHHGNPRLRCR